MESAASVANPWPGLIAGLAPTNPFKVRQQSAHKLASLLARADTAATVADLDDLRASSLAYTHLVALSTEAMARQPSDNVTLGLVVACLANLAARRVPLLDEGSAVGTLLAKVILSTTADDHSLLWFALAAAYNLSDALEVLLALDDESAGGALSDIENKQGVFKGADAECRKQAKKLLTKLLKSRKKVRSPSKAPSLLAITAPEEPTPTPPSLTTPTKKEASEVEDAAPGV